MYIYILEPPRRTTEALPMTESGDTQHSIHTHTLTLTHSLTHSLHPPQQHTNEPLTTPPPPLRTYPPTPNRLSQTDMRVARIHVHVPSYQQSTPTPTPQPTTQHNHLRSELATSTARIASPVCVCVSRASSLKRRCRPYKGTPSPQPQQPPHP